MPGAHGTNPGDAPPQGDHHVHKRKRDGDDGRSDRIPQPPPPQSGMSSMASGSGVANTAQAMGAVSTTSPAQITPSCPLSRETATPFQRFSPF